MQEQLKNEIYNCFNKINQKMPLEENFMIP